MRAIFLFCICFPLHIVAQQIPDRAKNIDMQAIQQKMKMAQAKLDSLKKTNPKLAGYDLRVPNVSQMMADNQARLARLQSKKAEIDKSRSQGLPKAKAGASVNALPKLTAVELRSMVQKTLTSVQSRLDPMLKKKLDEMLAHSNGDAAGAGIMLSSMGVPKFIGGYLICKSVLNVPMDIWAINDFGIICKENGQYADAFRCFMFASQFAPPSVTLNTNMGWAAAYLGDLQSANSYFDQVLAVFPQFQKALEGKAVVQLQLGDSGAMKKCLKDEIMMMAAGGAPVSSQFLNTCGGVIDNENDVNLDHQTDPTNDNTYDNAEGDQNNQDEPPGADDEDISYPSWKPVFVNSYKDLLPAIKQIVPLKKAAIKELEKWVSRVKTHEQQNKPLYQPPYTDEQGNVVIPHTPAKFVTLFRYTHQLFERRIYWYKKKFVDKIPEYRHMVAYHDMDLVKAYFKDIEECNREYELALKACGDDDRCRDTAEAKHQRCLHEVDCKWIPIFRGSKNSDIAAASTRWSEYFDKVLQTIAWYKKASSPFISRIHAQDWNEQTNLIREYDVRKAILDAYDSWSESVLGVYFDGEVTAIAQKEVSCKVEMPVPEDGPDPFSKKPKKLKTFAGPCYNEGWDIDLGIVEYEDNCDHTRITIGAGPVKEYIEKGYSRKFKEDDYYQTGVTLGIDKSVGAKAELDGWKLESKVKVGAEIEVYNRYNSDWQLTQTGASVTITGSYDVGISKSGVPSELGEMDIKGSASAKVEATSGMNGPTSYDVSGKTSSSVGRK